MRTVLPYVVVALALVLAPREAPADRGRQDFQLSCANVHSMQIAEFQGVWKIYVQLTPDGSRHLHGMTSRHTGDVFVLRAGEEELLAIVAHDPIVSGSIGMPCASEQAARELAAMVCPERLNSAPAPDAAADSQDRSSDRERLVQISFPPYVVSCDNVAAMQVVKIRVLVDWRSSIHVPVYYLHLQLTETGGQELDQILDTIEYQYGLDNGRVIHAKGVRLLAGGAEIVGDMPDLDSFSGQNAIIVKRTPQAALDAAQAICPAKAPSTIIDQTPEHVGEASQPPDAPTASDP